MICGEKSWNIKTFGSVWTEPKPCLEGRLPERKGTTSVGFCLWMFVRFIYLVVVVVVVCVSMVRNHELVSRLWRRHTSARTILFRIKKKISTLVRSDVEFSHEHGRLCFWLWDDDVREANFTFG
jgi:hypothetical protein